MDEEKLKQLKKQHGEIFEVEYGDLKFYFRKPNRLSYKRYYDKLLDSVYDAACILCLDVIVDPSSDQLAAFIEKEPTFPIKAVTELAGFFGSMPLRSRKI